MSEEEVKKHNREVKIRKFPTRANGRTRCLESTDGLVKIISDAKTDKMLGLHILVVENRVVHT